MIKKILFLSFFVMAAAYGDHKFTGLATDRHQDLLKVNKTGWDNHSVCRPYLFGDWCGFRKKLANKGITSTATYTSASLGNPVGGEQKAFAYADCWAWDFNFDLQKMYGLCGWQFYFNVGLRGGSNLARTIGNQFPPAQLYGNETFWLDNLYLQKTLLCERLRFRIGRLQAGDYFLQNPLFYQYVSNAFCGNPIAVFFNGVFSAYPNAQWGVYSDYKVTDHVLAKVAVFNTNPDTNQPKYHGVDFRFKNRDGAQIITEWSYLLNQGPCDQGLPGNYKVGYFVYTRKFPQFNSSCRVNNYGYYFMLDQMVYRQGCRWVRPFAALLFAPTSRNLFPFFFTSGIVAKGVVRCRPCDISAFGVAYGTYSKDLRKRQRHNHVATQNYEMVIELNHQIKVNKWLFIQPDMQYIIKPKGYDSIKNALVLGAQVGITF